MAGGGAAQPTERLRAVGDALPHWNGESTDPRLDVVTRLPGPEALRAARDLARRVVAQERRRAEDTAEDMD